MTEIQGKSILVRVSAKFELARVRVNGSRLYRFFCPFSARMQDKGFNFFMQSPAKMGHFFLEFTLFSLIKTQILSVEGMMNV